MAKLIKTFTNNGSIGYELLFNDEFHRLNMILSDGSRVWNGDTVALSEQLRQRYPDFEELDELVYAADQLTASKDDCEAAEAILRLTALEDVLRGTRKL